VRTDWNAGDSWSSTYEERKMKRFIARLIQIIFWGPLALSLLSVPVILLIVMSGWEPPPNNGISDSVHPLEKRK